MMPFVSQGAFGPSPYSGAATSAVDAADAPANARDASRLQPVDRSDDTRFNFPRRHVTDRGANSARRPIVRYEGRRQAPAPVDIPARATDTTPRPSSAFMAQYIAHELGLNRHEFSPGDYVGPPGHRPADAYQATLDRERFMLFSEGPPRHAA